jgi:hypothetical protein
MAVGGAVALPDWSPDELLSRAPTDDDDRLRPPLPSAPSSAPASISWRAMDADRKATLTGVAISLGGSA